MDNAFKQMEKCKQKDMYPSGYEPIITNYINPRFIRTDMRQIQPMMKPMSSNNEEPFINQVNSRKRSRMELDRIESSSRTDDVLNIKDFNDDTSKSDSKNKNLNHIGSDNSHSDTKDNKNKESSKRPKINSAKEHNIHKIKIKFFVKQYISGGKIARKSNDCSGQDIPRDKNDYFFGDCDIKLSPNVKQEWSSPFKMFKNDVNSYSPSPFDDFDSDFDPSGPKFSKMKYNQSESSSNF